MQMIDLTVERKMVLLFKGEKEFEGEYTISALTLDLYTKAQEQMGTKAIQVDAKGKVKTDTNKILAADKDMKQATIKSILKNDYDRYLECAGAKYKDVIDTFTFNVITDHLNKLEKMIQGDLILEEMSSRELIRICKKEKIEYDECMTKEELIEVIEGK